MVLAQVRGDTGGASLARIINHLEFAYSQAFEGDYYTEDLDEDPQRVAERLRTLAARCPE